MLVWSWDNLSSKAVLNEHPDRLLVWNELQAREAVELHGDPARSSVTGGRRRQLRPFFEELATVAAASSTGADRSCTSARRRRSRRIERAVFDRWLAAVRDRPRRRPGRPPSASGRAGCLGRLGAPEGVEVVDPRAKIEPKALSRLLAEADAVVALNTSAEIEAAIAGKPVLTFRAGPGGAGSGGLGALPLPARAERRLRPRRTDARGARREARRRPARRLGPRAAPSCSSRRFVRPNGLERPVTPLLAEAILEAAASESMPAGRPPRRLPAQVARRASRASSCSLRRASRASSRTSSSSCSAADATLLFSGRRQKRPRIPSELKSSPHVEFVELPVEEPAALELLRAFRDAVRFHDPELEVASWPRRRATRRLLKLAHHRDWRRDLPELEQLRIPHQTCARIDDALADLERLIPSARELRDALGAMDVDLVFLVTRCTLSGHEGTIVKAARALGLPTLMLVWSWDNLSSKAVLHEHPDRLLVWNETQAGEAEELHGVPPERVEIVGAPNFDRFFAAVDAAGDRRKGKTIVYLGSSTNVAPDEPSIFARWLEAVRAEPSLRDAEIVVRPHPAGEAWLDWSPPGPHISLQRPEQKVEHERARRAARPGRRCRRPEHERRDRGGDRPTAGADVPCRRGRARPGGLDPLRLPARAERRLRARRRRRSRITSRGWRVCSPRGPTPAALERFVERFVRPRGIDDARRSDRGRRGARARRRPARHAGRRCVRLLVSSSPWSLARWLPGVVGELLDSGAELVFASPAGTDPLPEAAHGRPETSRWSSCRSTAPRAPMTDVAPLPGARPTSSASTGPSSPRPTGRAGGRRSACSTSPATRTAARPQCGSLRFRCHPTRRRRRRRC